VIENIAYDIAVRLFPVAGFILFAAALGVLIGLGVADLLWPAMKRRFPK
jgi:hypothetical protein